MKHSVLIPTYNQPDLTVVHVRECMNSTRIPDEIIVVNDHGDLSVRDKLKALDIKTRIVYAYILDDIMWNYNGACNLAFFLSRGDYISIEDSDHIPYRGAYEAGINALDNESKYSRVHYTRRWVPIADTVAKPFEEWEPYGKLGPNQMVTMMRRELYQTTKGQDERLCGRYGYMATLWVSQYKRLQTSSIKCDGYFIIKDGSEPNLIRGMSLENRRIYKELANSSHVHSNYGILNFKYQYEIL